jgi:hypothetical protein
MFSGETIRRMSDDAARKAARTKREPYVLFDRAEVERIATFPFPNLGSYVPKGWTMVEHFMADATGLGSENEPALTPRQLKARLVRDVDAGNRYGYAIVEVGQFQVVIGVFERVTPKARRARKEVRPS